MNRSPSSGGGKRPPTRKDVAERANVSTATVSYVLNKTYKIPEPTAARVISAAKELGYRGNHFARSLATNKSKQLAIVLNNIANPIYSDLILGFESRAIEKGYFVNICTGYSNIDEYFDSFIARRIDGLFVEALPYKFHKEKLTEMVAAGIKLIQFGHPVLDQSIVSCIETDYFSGIDAIFSYLVSMGHHRIAYVSGLSRKDSDCRISAYQKAADTAGIEAGARKVIAPRESTPTGVDDGMQLTRRLLEKDTNCTAILCTNDLMAVGAMQVLREKRIRVPMDISVIGIDDAWISTITDPPLTTLSIDYKKLGALAFSMLYADISADEKGHYKISPRLIIRESSAPTRSALI